MRTIQLTLAYDGTRYAGWQVQPDRVSVQQVVESAVRKLTGEAVKIAASGRTDAGVHALGQVVTFNTALAVPVEGYRWGLVTTLPDDVVVVDACERPYGFHARFDAFRKTYRYVIHTSRTPTPWLRHYVWWHRSSLDVAAMQVAANLLVGTHDFRCFETQWPNRSSSVRTIFSARWAHCDIWQPWSSVGQTPSGTDEPSESVADAVTEPVSREGAFLCFDISADGFLYNMVRAIVGTLVHVGRGRWTPADVARILSVGDRSHAGDTAPAQGLYLLQVELELDESRLADRITRLQARAADREEPAEDDTAEA